MKNLHYFIVFCFCISCAQFVPPTGGKRDITPPKLLESIPSQNTKNFKDRSVTLTFDEYIDYSSLKQDLLITPAPKGNYIIKEKNKSLKLIFDQDFDQNTTYTFNFRNGIKDLNERNPANNMKLAFSTGPYLDSIKISGKIINIQTKQPVLNATFALYKIDTSNYLKRKPDYFIKTDSSGNYSLENLKTGTYKSLIFTDNNNNLLYDQKNEMLAFADSLIDLSKNKILPTLELYSANNNKNKVKKSISREHEYILQLDKACKSFEINNPSDTTTVLLRDPLNLVIFPNKSRNSDTLKYSITLTDSIGNKDTINPKVYYTKPLKSLKKGPFNISSDIKSLEYLTKTVDYNLKFDFPITEFNLSKIIFKTDTLLTEKPTIIWTNKTTLNIRIDTKAKKQIEILIPSATFTNSRGDTNTFTYFKNSILQSTELGSFSGFTKEKNTKKIVQLINNLDNKIYKQLFFKDKYSFKDIIPGSYFVKIIYDSNNNNIWDPGNLTALTQPEKIVISGQPIKIKANFEIKDQNIE